MSEPKIRKSELTGQWYVITRWHTKIKGDKAVFVADKKHDVTDQMQQILGEENRRLNEALDGLEAKWRTGGPKPDCTCPANTHFHRGNCPAYLWRLATQGNSAIMRKICADELSEARAAIQQGEGNGKP